MSVLQTSYDGMRESPGSPGGGIVNVPAKTRSFRSKALESSVSPLGSADKQLIGCRQVAYFEPLNMIVLNTTVIFDAHQKQKNLDPLQKCTSDYIHEKYPKATRLAVVTSPELRVANWNNYTTNGFPWNKGDGTYEYLEMVNIDATVAPTKM